MNIDELWLKRIAATAKDFQARELSTGQNGASNAADDPRAALETGIDDKSEAVLRYEIGRHGPGGVANIMALTLLGQDTAVDLDAAKEQVRQMDGSLEDHLVTTPLLAHYLIEGYEKSRV